MKPDGAPDLLMPLDITDAWIDMHMAGEGARSAWGGGGVGRPEVPEGGQPKPKVAAARAMASARMNPSVLIKVTCHTTEESILVAKSLSIMVTSLDFLADKDHPSSRSKEGWPILELKNKSGIMIVLDKPRKKDVKRSDTTGSPQPRSAEKKG